MSQELQAGTAAALQRLPAVGYEANCFWQKVTGSAIPELQGSTRSQGLRIPGTVETIFETSAWLQNYINGAISQSRQKEPFGALLLRTIKGGTIINSSGEDLPIRSLDFDKKPYFWEDHEIIVFWFKIPGSGIPERQALIRNQGLRILGSAAAKFQASTWLIITTTTLNYYY